MLIICLILACLPYMYRTTVIWRDAPRENFLSFFLCNLARGRNGANSFKLHNARARRKLFLCLKEYVFETRLTFLSGPAQIHYCRTKKRCTNSELYNYPRLSRCKPLLSGQERKKGDAECTKLLPKCFAQLKQLNFPSSATCKNCLEPEVSICLH